MFSPATTASTANVAATYTTIPISGGDVISRSVQNLANFVSRHRPWSEFVASGVFDVPDSLSVAGNRLQRNAKYFSINYGIIITACIAFSLIGDPIGLIVYAFLFAMWLVLHFFREDPMVVYGHHVDDWIVIVALILGSMIVVWFTGMVNSLLIGISVGFLISTVHGVFRNPEGLFLDEGDAASNGLITSPSAFGSQRKNFSR